MMFFIADPNNLVYVWLIVAVLFLFAEIGTPGLFFFIAFAIGCTITAGVSFLGYSFAAQCVVALTTSLISFFVLRYYFSVKKQNGVQTNADALTKQEGVITKTVALKKTGRVKVRGEEWPAEVEEDVVIKEGSVVKIVRVKGNRLIVKN